MCHLSIKFLPEINNGSVLKKITMINEAHIFEENIIRFESICGKAMTQCVLTHGHIPISFPHET